MDASCHTRTPYRKLPKRKKVSTVLPKFWDFLVKLAQKGVISLTELMENVTLGGVECSVGSCGGSGGTSVYGFIGTSPPIAEPIKKEARMFRNLIATGKEKVLYGSTVLLAFGMLFSSCGKCKDSKSDFPAQKDENGKVWVLTDWNDKTCQPIYEEKPGNPVDSNAIWRADSTRLTNQWRKDVTAIRNDPISQSEFDGRIASILSGTTTKDSLDATDKTIDAMYKDYGNPMQGATEEQNTMFANTKKTCIDWFSVYEKLGYKR